MIKRERRRLQIKHWLDQSILIWFSYDVGYFFEKWNGVVVVIDIKRTKDDQSNAISILDGDWR